MALLLNHTTSSAVANPDPVSDRAIWDEDTKAFLSWAEGAISDEQAFSALTPLLSRLTKSAARRYRLTPDLQDDCYQELASVLLLKLRKTFHPEWGCSIASLLSGYAWRIAAHLARRERREIPVDELYDETLFAATDAPWMSAQGLVVPSPEALIERHAHGVIDPRHRRETLSTQAAAIDRALAAIDPTAKPKRASRKRTTITRRLQAMAGGKPLVGNPSRKFDMRLRLARRAMGLTRSQMAQSLGMPLWRYTKYESGQVTPVPDALYQQVQALRSNLSHRQRITAAFEGYAMSEIVAFWTALLEQAGCSTAPADVRDVLQISPRTMQRWSYDFYKPKENIVICHHELVEEYVKAHAPHLRTLPE